MKRSVRVYVEGGAIGKTADQDFRRGWKKFLMEIHDFCRSRGFDSLEIVRGKGRRQTYQRFINHKVEHPQDLCVLLVDSECLVSEGQNVWDVVATRPADQWIRPDWASERHLYLIVQFVETWLLTDVEALKKFFKQGFVSDNLPSTNLEGRSKHEIEQALKRATRNSRKGAYHHGQSHEIMEFVDPSRVRSLAHANRLFTELSNLIIQDSRS